jgi:hypothetical protein
LITALCWGECDHGTAGTTAADAGTLESAPRPIATAAILNFKKRKTPLLSCLIAGTPGQLPAKGTWSVNVERAQMFRIWKDRLQTRSRCGQQPSMSGEYERPDRQDQGLCA